MATAYTSLLGLALPVTGELSGTWGDTVNDFITQYTDAAVAGTQTISGSQTAVTLSVTNGAPLSQVGSGSTGSAQYAVINCTGSPASLLTITVPASSRQYMVINATSTNQSVKVVGVGPTTGVTMAAGEEAIIAWNGSDFIKIASSTGVSGPASSTDNAIARFDGTTGQIIQDSSVIIADDGSMVISTNSSTSALRITQTGSGNALVVEDSTNPDSTPFVVNADGKLVVGATTLQNPRSGRTVSAEINSVNVTTEDSLALTKWANTVNSNAIVVSRSRGTSVGAQTVLSNGDIISEILSQGSDGTAFIPAASITTAVDGTPGTNDMPGRLVFSTTADGASAATERFRISNFGGWGLAGANYGTSGTQAIVSNGNAAAPTWQDVVTPTGTQTLTNKTISGASNTVTNISLTTGVTGTLPAANGGTGLTSPGTAGNVLTSNGSAWVSSTPASGGTAIGLVRAISINCILP